MTSGYFTFSVSNISSLLLNKIDNDDDRCHLLLALIGAPTYKLLSSLCAPKQPGELKFKDICDTLKKHYSPQPIKIAERYRFYNRKQLEGESAADYLAHLRQLASTCQFGSFLDEALCDRLVCGVRDPGVVGKSVRGILCPGDTLS